MAGQDRDAIERFLAEPAAVLLGDLLRYGGEGDSQPGEILSGRYRIEAEIGKGGFGTVYRAADLRLDGKPVAVKLLHEYWTASPWMRLRFQEEMKALARIRHAGIVTVFDFGETESGRSFLVMELVEGQTLRSILASGPLASDRAARVLEQIGDALAAAHEAGVLHRDLKPENIVVLGDGAELKLVDFGVARVAEPAGVAQRTTLITGTPDYMAPEQFSGRATSSTDIYALAVIAFEILTGVRPSSERRPGQIPGRVSKLLEQALSKDEAARPASAREFATDLATALRAGPSWIERTGRRRVLTMAVTAPALVLGGWTAFEYSGAGDLAAADRLIANRGAQYPRDSGFKEVAEIDFLFLPNEARNGYDRKRLRSADQGAYARPLSRRQKAHAWKRGFRLFAEISPEQGMVSVGVDLVGFGPRFDFCIWRRGDGQAEVLLIKQVAVAYVFDVFPVTLAPGQLIPIALILEPETGTTRLEIEGAVRFRGYRGHPDYQEDHGVHYGCSKYESERASGVVRDFRFEIA